MVRQNATLVMERREKRLAYSPRTKACSLVLLLAVLGCQGGFDMWGPTIDIEQDQPVGLAPTSVLVSAADSNGVVSLTIKQRDGSVLLDQTYSPAAPSISEELLLSAAVDISPENQLLLAVTAQDSSGHTTSREIAIPYSEKIPEVSVVNAPQSLTVGEPAIAIIQAKGEGVEAAGLMFGSTIIPGIRLTKLNIRGSSDQFLTLFSPAAVDERSSLRAYGRNSALNTRSIPISTSILPAQVEDRRIRMREEEIVRLVSSTTPFLRRETNLLDPSVVFSKEGLDPKTARSSFFGSVLEVNKSGLSRLLRRKTGQSDYFKSALLKPIGQLLAPFNSRITILTDDLEYPLGSFPFQIWEIGAPSVESIGEGRVLFNETLGPLGTVVGVDMGMGLVITYGLLESSTLSIGTRILPRTIMGIPHRRPGANFGIYALGAFVSGYPANPAHFSDPDWFESTIGKHMAS